MGQFAEYVVTGKMRDLMHDGEREAIEWPQGCWLYRLNLYPLWTHGTSVRHTGTTHTCSLWNRGKEDGELHGEFVGVLVQEIDNCRSWQVLVTVMLQQIC